jgi:hypothetical protein
MRPPQYKSTKDKVLKTMLGEAPLGREAVPVKYQQAAFEKEYRDRIARCVGRMLVGRGTHGTATQRARACWWISV